MAYNPRQDIGYAPSKKKKKRAPIQDYGKKAVCGKIKDKILGELKEVLKDDGQSHKKTMGSKNTD